MDLSCPQFLGEEARPIGRKRVSFIPAPFAETVSWVSGTDRGPSAIIDASPALEVFDDELLIETVAAGLVTLPALDLAGHDEAEVFARIFDAVGRELAEDCLPVLLGGEHTVTLPSVAACARKHPDLHVVQVDAHLDLRDSYDDTPFSHACVMRRIHDLALPFTQVGMRSFSGEEWTFVRREQLRPFTMARIRNEPDWIDQICAEIDGPVYLTFDVDGLDPSVVPATGTPEPDGLYWHEAAALMRAIARRKRIVGLDFVEFSPAPGAHHAAFAVAKLIYRTLGYIFQPMLTKEKE